MPNWRPSALPEFDNQLDQLHIDYPAAIKGNLPRHSSDINSRIILFSWQTLQPVKIIGWVGTTQAAKAKRSNPFQGLLVCQTLLMQGRFDDI